MDDVSDRLWDVVVVGAGMGGATIGHSLASQGFSVLFLERGRAPVLRSNEGDDSPESRLDRAVWPDQVISDIDGRVSESFAALGAGPGGSTLLYGAALERFSRTDLDDSPDVPHPAGGWPVSYDAMRPWYEQAEALYAVRGTRDPLCEPLPAAMARPAPASPQDREFMRSFAAAGLHPYRLHVGIAYKPGCNECLGTICPQRCKSDARTICLDPALALPGAQLLTDCTVTRLEADASRVTQVRFDHKGTARTVRGRMVVVAAGTYNSPGLLLRSTGPDWPQGLGNQNDQVGRNLMFHSSDWIAMWPQRRMPAWGPRKTIGLRDFYTHQGRRLGQIQSTGLSADYGNVLMFLQSWFDRSGFRHLRFVRPFLRIPAKIATYLFGSATLFAMIIEDFGEPENRILIDPAQPDRITYRYRISDDLRARTALARKLVRERLPGLRKYWLLPELLLDTGHATGTCRFGTDPATSVLDVDCKVHGVDNLYVVDGSFMPSSAGINPSLTIAANALRVGAVIAGRLREDAA